MVRLKKEFSITGTPLLEQSLFTLKCRTYTYQISEVSLF